MKDKKMNYIEAVEKLNKASELLLGVVAEAIETDGLPKHDTEMILIAQKMFHRISIRITDSYTEALEELTGLKTIQNDKEKT